VNAASDTHCKINGYILWIFRFTDAQRFYYGKPVSGTIRYSESRRTESITANPIN
jgi:TM2 domain-containing membrane protein YozV